MHAADFDFALPEELVAQHPVARRDASRLLVIDRRDGPLQDHRFLELPQLLQPGDLLVLNDSKVMRARLHAVPQGGGGMLEFLLLSEKEEKVWWAMAKPGKRARVGARLALLDRLGRPSPWRVSVLDTNRDGHRLIRMEGPGSLVGALDELGEVPLPPYIHRREGQEDPEDAVRYQTVYARHLGSVAAPTAGLHLTDEVLERLRARGVEIAYLTLHVGPGTFAPVKSEQLEDHTMHEERFVLPEEAARQLERARQDGRRVIAVGTSAVRVLESLALQQLDGWQAASGCTRIFIYPPFRFRVVQALITNFHLPRSTLLMLVSAFAAPGETDGRHRMLRVYEEAVRRRYRFFSYGDAMLIL